MKQLLNNCNCSIIIIIIIIINIVSIDQNSWKTQVLACRYLLTPNVNRAPYTDWLLQHTASNATTLTAKLAVVSHNFCSSSQTAQVKFFYSVIYSKKVQNEHIKHL
jgi:hypothetical protein